MESLSGIPRYAALARHCRLTLPASQTWRMMLLYMQQPIVAGQMLLPFCRDRMNRTALYTLAALDTVIIESLIRPRIRL